jgi:hypothetical protein
VQLRIDALLTTDLSNAPDCPNFASHRTPKLQEAARPRVKDLHMVGPLPNWSIGSWAQGEPQPIAHVNDSYMPPWPMPVFGRSTSPSAIAQLDWDRWCTRPAKYRSARR